MSSIKISSIEDLKPSACKPKPCKPKSYIKKVETQCIKKKVPKFETVMVETIETVEPETVEIETIQTIEPVSISYNSVPWAMIILLILGAIIVMYTAIAPNITSERRIFGIVITILWVAIWTVILWVLWRNNSYESTWWALLIPITMLLLFFILIILLNLGTNA